ncbi:MAG: M42 family peptidase [Bacilli bacterium]|nr:M42 family peptidase [Bacilli bacterium]
MDKKFLFDLLKTPSPSGYEIDIQRKIIDTMKPYSDKVLTHHSLNVVNVLNPDSKMKVLLSGHIDEISLVIDKVLDNGTIKMQRNGGIRPYMYLGQHVNVIHKVNGKIKYVPGVIGYVPDLGKNEVKVNDLVLDLGTSSKEETLKLVSVGDPVIHMNDYVELANGFLSGRALDNRLGAFICLEVLKKAKEKGGKNGVYASSTVGEESTYRGAIAAADNVKPTCAIITDVCYAADLPYRENLTGSVALGKGPVLTIGSEMNSIIFEKMKEACKKLGINYQIKVTPEQTATDTDEIFHRQQGIPSFLISIPLRYMHSSVEVCSLKDVEDIINLMAQFILDLDENTNFNPFEN